MLYVLERKDKNRLAVESDTLRRTHLPDELLAYTWKMIPDERFKGTKFLRATMDMGTTVGTASVVKAPAITPTTRTTFARRRSQPYRVQELGMKPKTRFVTVVAEYLDRNEQWNLRNAYCGQYIYPQPWDLQAIIREQRTMRDALNFWCRAAYCYASREFEAPYQTNWATLIDEAVERSSQVAADKAGYYEVRRLWHKVEEERHAAIQAGAAYRSFRVNSGR